MRFRCVLLGFALLLAGPASGGELERTFPLGAGGKLVIALDFGSVAVLAHEDVETVRIQALSRGVGASGVHFAGHAEGEDVFFEGDAEPWLEYLQSAPGVRVRAWVPPQTRVTVRSAGDVEVLRAVGGLLVLSP
jgi:hypothetical protein